MIFIILFIRYIIISILLNNYIFKRDKQESGSGNSSGTGTGTGTGSGCDIDIDSGSSSGIDTLPDFYRTLRSGITYEFTRCKPKKNSKKSQENTKKE